MSVWVNVLQHRDRTVWGPSKKRCHPNSWQLTIKEKENKHFCLPIMEFTIYPSLWVLDRAPAPAEGFGSSCPRCWLWLWHPSQAEVTPSGTATLLLLQTPQNPWSAPCSAPGLGCQQGCQQGVHHLPRGFAHWKLLLGRLKIMLGNIKITPHSL